MKKIYFFLIALAVTATHAQDGSLDLGYEPVNTNPEVTAMARLSDGSIIYASRYTDSWGDYYADVEKLNPDGSLNSLFNFSGTISTIFSICIQADGKIVIGGYFGAMRLHSTGAVDSTFINPSNSNSVSVYDVVLQPVTNKILIATGGGTVHKGVYRLNNDGSIDDTFNTNGSGVIGGFGFDRVHDIETYSNGDMIIVGKFFSYNGSLRRGMAKLNANGTLNTTVFPDFVDSTNIKDAEIQTDGKIIVVGGNNNATTVEQIMRFNTNGTLDTTFTGPTGASFTLPIRTVELQADGRIVIGGKFQSLNGLSRRGIARLNTDGSVDTCFDPDNGLSDNPTLGNGEANDLLIQPDNKILVAGVFSYYDGTARSAIARVYGQTSIDAVPDTGIINTAGGVAVANVLFNDLLNGSIPSLGNVTLTQISTTHSGINLNTTTRQVIVNFGVPLGMHTVTYKICVIGTGTCFCDTADVTVYVANTINAVNDEVLISFTTNNQSAGNVLVNDLYAGSTATLANVTVTTQGTLPTGLLHDGSGNFTANGVAPGNYEITYQICDNDVPGNCDTATFTLIVTTPNAGLGLNDERADNTVRVSGVQTTNGIIIAGDFNNYGGVSVNKIARLKPQDLTLDTSFITSGPVDGSYQPLINDFKILPTDEIIVVGRWGSSFNGVSTQGRNIAKLDPNGVPDQNWNYGYQGATSGSVINALAIVPSDLSIVVVGTFISFNGPPRYHMARLHQGTGNVINSFNQYVSGDTGFTGGVPLCVAIQNNTHAIIGGSFTHLNGTPVGGIVRVSLSTGAIDYSFDTTGVPAGSRIEEILVAGGDIYVGGSFNMYDGNQRRNIAKLDANGNLAGAFIGGFNSTVRSIVLQQTPSSFIDEAGASNLYVGGDFTAHNYAGTPTTVSRIACIHPMSGAINQSLNIGGASNNIHTLTLENSKVKLIIGGEFTQYNNIQAQRVTRIFPGYTGNDLVQGQGRFNTIEGKKPAGKDIIIYPNPGNGIYTVDFKGYEQQIFDVVIHNTLGQEIYRTVIKAEGSKLLDLTSFENGNYFITMQNNNETINKIITKR